MTFDEYKGELELTNMQTRVEGDIYFPIHCVLFAMCPDLSIRDIHSIRKDSRVFKTYKKQLVFNKKSCIGDEFKKFIYKSNVSDFLVLNKADVFKWSETSGSRLCRSKAHS
jgi:hypothetical protein